MERLAPDDAYDLVLVLLRWSQVEAALPALAANRRTPTVLFMVSNPSGPAAWIRALGRERVVLGFAGAGGSRDGHVVRYHILPRWQQATTVGELDGRVTPRLTAIVQSFAAGRYCLIDMHVPPGGGPGPHRHDFEEMFTVREGEIAVTFRGATSVARAGETVNIPANAPHSFTNAGDRPARLLCMCTPAGQDEFFRAVGVAVPSRTAPVLAG